MMDELYDSDGLDQIDLLRENEIWGPRHINVLLPLLDIPNHYHPQKIDKSDYYGFGLRVF
jgi:hypothetical protein